MRVQSPESIALARRVLAAYGWNWQAVRDASVRRDDGVLLVPRP